MQILAKILYFSGLRPKFRRRVGNQVLRQADLGGADPPPKYTYADQLIPHSIPCKLQNYYGCRCLVVMPDAPDYCGGGGFMTKDNTTE
jgi:hypothetical protein